MRFGFNFPIGSSIRGFVSFDGRRWGGMSGITLLVAAFLLLWIGGAFARPCATCATIADPRAQSLARDAARPRSTTPSTSATCATIADPRAQAVCRSRNQESGM